MKKLFVIGLLVLLVVQFASHTSAEIVNLYDYQTLVVTQDRSERNQATRDGLAEVILRASGQLAVLQDPSILGALSSPSRYLLEFRYEATDETLDVDGKPTPAWRLILKFSQESVTKLLRDRQLSIWPANRPSVLVWLVMDDGRGPLIASSASQPALFDVITESAVQRGVPIVLPLMDLEDQVALSAQSAWQLDEDAIARASERYQADSILVGRLTQTSRGDWRSAWQLKHRDGFDVFDINSEDILEIIGAGVNQTADYFFSLYGYQPSGNASERVIMQVADVRHFQDYVSLLNYLRGLAIVRGVDVSVALGNYLLLSVETEADVKLLQDAIALDSRMLPEPVQAVATVPPGQPENPLKYVWQN
ncbi:DUF2066 domain-containing protein [Aurantivibrio plasticivorans]